MKFTEIIEHEKNTDDKYLDLEEHIEAIEDERNKYLSLLQNIKAVVVDTDAMEYGHDADCRYIKDLLKDIPDG